MLCCSLNQASSKEEGDEPKKKKGKTEAKDDQGEVSVADPPRKRLRKVRMKTQEFDALAEGAYANADAEPLPNLSPAQRLQRYLEKQKELKEGNGENIPSEKANAKDEAKKKRKTAKNTEAKKAPIAKQIKKAEAEQSEKAKAEKKVKGKKAQSPEQIKAKKERTPEQIEKAKARSRKCIAYGKAYREAEGTEEERRAMAQKVPERH